jgi:hypothetical protein
MRASARRSPELTRCQARHAAEILGQAALARKSGGMRNHSDRAFFAAKERHSVFYPPLLNKSVRRLSD